MVENSKAPRYYPADTLSLDQLAYWIAFSRVQGIGPVRFQMLLDYFHEDIASAWQADRQDLAAAGLDQRTITTLLDQRAKIIPERELAREEKTIHFTISVERHLLDYIRTERAQYDPKGGKRLEDLDDGDPLFLTRSGKPYNRRALYYHWNRLFAPAQHQFKKGEQVEFTVHDLRHLRVTRTVTKLRQDAKGDRAVEAALLEGFNDLMGWRSPETMATYLKTMNKRQAIQAVLEDEEAQEKAENSPLASTSPISGQPDPELSQKLVLQEKTQVLFSENNTDEFDWYEDEE